MPTANAASVRATKAASVRTAKTTSVKLPSKSERTEAAIVDAAIELFSDQGYENTTMRQIADRAGVSVGNSYYYFASKEALVQALYDRFSEATFDVAMQRVAEVDTLADRIIQAMLAWVETMAPYKRFGAAFFRSAADFSSPVSPFSRESAGIREHSVSLWQAVLEGSTDLADLGPAIRDRSSPRLAQLLWLYALAIVAVWSQDQTPTSERTERIIRRSAPLLAQVVKLAGTSLFEPVANEVLGLIDEIAALRDPDSSKVQSTM